MELGFPPKRRRLVLFPCPFQGHITPMLQLATTLLSKGFSITIVHTQFNSPNPSNHPDFTFLSIPDEISESDIASGDFIALILKMNVHCSTPLKNLLVRVMDNDDDDDDDDIGCIIFDAVMYFVEKVAESLKIPGIIFRTSNAANMMTYNVYPRLQKEGKIPLQDSMMLELIPELQPLRYKDLPIFKFKNLNEVLELIGHMKNITSSSAIIWNTLDCLEHSSLTQLHHQYQIPFFPIGPLLKISKPTSSSLIKEDTSCLTWLDQHPKNSVIYISLGSIASMDENQLLEMAYGLARSKQPFLWVIRSDNDPFSGFKELVGGNGRIVKWAPQKEVLEHASVGGFWSHCGWNSCLESVSDGVPMICQPCFGDQRVNARFLSQIWKVGFQIESDLERGEIEMAIRRLMVDDEGEEMRLRAKELKEKVDLSVMENGSSYNSLIELIEFITSF